MKKIMLALLMSSYGVNLCSMQVDRLPRTPDFIENMFSRWSKPDIEQYLSDLDNINFNELVYSLDGVVGYSLVHLVVYYDYAHLIDIMKKKGANLYIKSTPGTGSVTPCALAFALERNACFAKFLEYAAVRFRQKNKFSSRL